MGFFANALESVAAAAVAAQAGRHFVQQLAQYKSEHAEREIDAAVERLVGQRDGGTLSGILEEFGNLIKLADSWEEQDSMNQLLWYFKERVAAELAKSGYSSERSDNAEAE